MRLKDNYLTNLPSWILFLILVFPFVLASHIPYGISVAGIVMICWLYLVGNSLKEKVELINGVAIRWFNISLLYSALYIVTLDVLFKNSLPRFILPLHLIAVISIFGALFFVSKLLVTSEEKRIVKNNRCVGTFFLFWFFPVGIWFVHPRIRKVLRE